MSVLLASALALGGEGERVTPSALMSSPWKRNVAAMCDRHSVRGVREQMKAFKVF